MTRTDYLTQLETYLNKLPEADRIEAMDYFKELFDDAGSEGEEELIASLGTPKEAAHDVPASSSYRNSGRDRHPHGHHRYYYRSRLRHSSLLYRLCDRYPTGRTLYRREL